MVRGFYLVVSLWMTLLVVIGFWPTYFDPLLAGDLSIKPVLHIHAVIFLGWMLLLLLQASLVFVKKVRWHRKLGLFGVGYAILILAVGIWTTFDRFFTKLGQESIKAAHQSLVIPFFDLLLFASFFSAAVIFRRKPETHKRLMLVATLVLLGPAVSRMPFLTTIPQLFVVILSPILFGIMFDLITQHKVHMAYIIGILAFIGSGIRLPLRESETWLNFSQWIMGIFM